MIVPPGVVPLGGVSDSTDGAAYDVNSVERSETWPPTVTSQKFRRPVPGAVTHVIAVCGVETTQPCATYSMPEGP
jgi:hypothetical protein